MPDVLLVVPPFLNPTGPALGPEVLAGACRVRGIDCAVLYANLAFAAQIGDDTYRRLMLPRDWREVGEAAFAPEAFPGLPDAAAHLFTPAGAVPRQPGHEDDADERCYAACRALAPGFIAETAAAIAAMEPRIVGFSAVCLQTFASLALARALRARAPEMLIVLGGPAALPPMGQALADVAPMLDCVVGGEADLCFPRLCRDCLQGGARPPRFVDCGYVPDLDDTAPPDYAAYSRQLARFQAEGSLPDRYPGHVFFESSRGCWWGDSCTCRFCGIPRSPFRRKTDDRILDELRALGREHAGIAVWAGDCVMPRELPGGVLSRLVSEGERIDLRYEVRADLGIDDLSTLAALGSRWLQPGIESLCPSVLKAFRKGVRAAQSIRLLRECRSLGIGVAWNFLYRIPGDDLQEYREVVRILPALSHLHAPMSFSSITLLRGSPYFEEAERFGFTHVRPLDDYRHLYPPETRFEDIGAVFQARWPSALDDDAALARELERELEAWTVAWRAARDRPALYKVPLPRGRVFVHDSRRCARQEAFLGDERVAAALKHFDTPRTEREAGTVPSEVLTDLLDRAFVIHWDGRYVSLVTEGGAP